MQSIFRLPWSSDQFGLGAADKIRFGKAVAPVRPDATASKPVKRKRPSTPDAESKSRSDAKRQRPSPASTIARSPASAITSIMADNLSADACDVTSSPQSTDRSTKATNNSAQSTTVAATEKMEAMAIIGDTSLGETQSETMVASQRRSKLCQAIENQINLQILLKHNELRLIDQELAKCQIALEQLRRCELQPYPGVAGFDYAVSTGTGPAVQPAQDFTVPTHAPPYGVVDGPYTRHYRQWLVPDPQFDSHSIQSSPTCAMHAAPGARGSRVGRKIVTSVPYGVPQRHDHASLSQNIAPLPKKDTNMPLVLRRSTDNKLVKLVCNNCNRGNMSSIQGFLNHCRIAHKVIYESHDAAAKDCGRVLDDQELASLPAETQSQPVSKPVVRHALPKAPAVAVAPQSTASVHPFNTPNAKIKHSKPPTTAKPVSVQSSVQPAQHASSSFKPAISLPRLSAFFARKQAGGDLEQAAIEARAKSELGLEEILSPASATPGSPAVAMSKGAVASNAHTFHGGKGRPQITQRSYFAPPQVLTEQQDLESPRDANHSPHAIDSNPGLVSDLEDDDNASASEEETSALSHAIGHPLGMTRTCGDSMDIAVAEDEAGVHHGAVIIRRNSTFGAGHHSLHGGSSSK